MKYTLIFTLTTLLVTSNSNAQELLSIEQEKAQREQVAEYESNKIYIQFADGESPEIEFIDKHNAFEIAQYSELVSLLMNDEISTVQQSFKVLAKRNEAISRVYTVDFSGNNNLDPIIEKLEQLSYVKLVERIPVYRHSLAPNDADYANASKRWHLDQVSAEAAWDITTGCGSVSIAVVDDAVLLSHEDLNAKIYTNTLEIDGNGIDDDGNGYVDDINGYDVADNDNNTNPPATASNTFFTHGTHVAGIAAAESNNGLGNASLGYNTMIIPVKVKGDNNVSQGTLNNPMAGVEYAIAVGADVINMSWGGYGYSSIDQLVFSQAYSEGIVCVAAAGNDGMSFLAYPANYTNVISVGASSQTNDLALFTNMSNDLDIFAPGVDIWSTLAGGNSSYGNLSGTSMSAPIISGLAALMICNDPLMSPMDIENCIHNSADTYTSTLLNGYTVRVANAQQSLICSAPLASTCGPYTCELIANGDFETPANSNISLYGGWSAIADQDVCGWDSYHGTVDCLPLDVDAFDNYAHFIYDGVNGGYWEGLVSNSMNIVAGETYILEFDYAQSSLSNQSPSINLDSIVIALLDNSFVFDMWDPFATAPNITIDAITDVPVDLIYDSYWALHDGSVSATDMFNHHVTTFVAPANTSLTKLLFYPVEDMAARREIHIDNVSVRPVIDVVATVVDPNITEGDCTTLSATGNGSAYIWEPEDEFVDNEGATQVVCPDSTILYTVTAYDSISGCTSSDTITINVEPFNAIQEGSLINAITIYPNPTSDRLVVNLAKVDQDVSAEVLDMNGKQFMQIGLVGNTENSIEISMLPSGVYHLRIENFGVIEFIKND